MPVPFNMIATTAESVGTLVKGLFFGRTELPRGVDAKMRRPAESLEEYLRQAGILAPTEAGPTASASVVYRNGKIEDRRL